MHRGDWDRPITWSIAMQPSNAEKGDRSSNLFTFHLPSETEVRFLGVSQLPNVLCSPQASHVSNVVWLRA
jgi:hypothetical protein